jgi:hypothetical protein
MRDLIRQRLSGMPGGCQVDVSVDESEAYQKSRKAYRGEKHSSIPLSPPIVLLRLSGVGRGATVN